MLSQINTMFMNWEKYNVRYFKFKRASSHELTFLVLSQLDGSHLSRSTSRRYLSRYGWRRTWAQIVQPNLPALIESKNSFYNIMAFVADLHSLSVNRRSG